MGSPQGCELIDTRERALTLDRPIPLDRHPVAVYLARLAPGSRRSMRQALGVVAQIASGGMADAESFAWPALRYQHVQAIRAVLAERYAPGSANKILTALRGVLKEAWRLGYMGAEDYHRSIDVAPVRGQRELAGRAVSMGELRVLFESCAREATPGAALDAALLGVLTGCGLRRAEAAALQLEDYTRDPGSLRVRHGKGDKARTVPCVNSAQSSLESWLVVRGDAPGALFVPVDRHGRVQVEGRARSSMSPEAIYARLQRRARAAGVAHFSPHDLRRTLIGELLDAGADIAAVQRLAGHASVVTTARYDRRPEHAKRRAAGLLHLPFVEFTTKEAS